MLKFSLSVLSVTVVALIFFISLVPASSAIENLSSSFNAVPIKIESIGRGSASVPIISVELDEQETKYENMGPGRLKFEVDGRFYAIQLRRVKKEYVDFIVMTLDQTRQGDISAYAVEGSFRLLDGERREIDIDKDGTNDVLIKLDKISNVERKGSFRPVADIFVQKVDSKSTGDISHELREILEENEPVKEVNSKEGGIPSSTELSESSQNERSSTLFSRTISMIEQFFGRN